MQLEDSDLFRAVLAEPDSDAPRERFAAWLAANGEAERAELIRIQLEEARTPRSSNPDEPDEGFEQRAAQVVELLKAHPEWRVFPELPGIHWGQGTSFGFQRGFLGSIRVTGSEAFRTQMGRVFELAPVTIVMIEAIDDAGVAEVAMSPFLARIRYLNLNYCPIGDAAAEALAASPNVVRLKTLRLYRCAVGARGARALASSPSLAATVELDIRGNPIDASSAAVLRERFGENLCVDGPEERGRHPLLDASDDKLLAHFRNLTSSLGAGAPAQVRKVECTVRSLPGAPEGVHTRVVYLQGERLTPTQVQPAVRQAVAELVRFWTTEGGGFPGVRATMTRQPDGSWQVSIARLDASSHH